MTSDGTEGSPIKVFLQAAFKGADFDDSVVDQIADALQEGGAKGLVAALQSPECKAALQRMMGDAFEGFESSILSANTRENAMQAQENASVQVNQAAVWRRLMAPYMRSEDDSEVDAAKKQSKAMNLVASGVSKLADAGLKSVQGSFEFIEQIYEKMKQASPLLETIGSLIDLAMTLFFLPLGTKLADTLLPAVTDLLDAVVDMWDAFEGMTLGEMFEYAMEYGMELAGTFLNEIAGSLQEQGGILGNIGDLIAWLGDFITKDGLGLLNTIVSLVNFVVDNLKEIISLIIAMYAMVAELQILSMINNAIGESILGKTGTAVATAVTFAGAFVASDAIMTSLGMAEGGYVPATEGGSLHLLGEAGEGEYVIPESRMSQMGVTNNFYISGLTYEDLPQVIDERVDLAISRSRAKGAFRRRRTRSSRPWPATARRGA